MHLKLKIIIFPPIIIARQTAYLFQNKPKLTTFDMKNLKLILIAATLTLISVLTSCTKQTIFNPEVEIIRADIPAMDFIKIRGDCVGETTLIVEIGGITRTSSTTEYGVKTYVLITIESERFEYLILKWRDSRGLNIKRYDNNTRRLR